MRRYTPLKRATILCLNCHQDVHIFGRGLCKPCYRQPQIRQQYASERGWSLTPSASKQSPIPPEPTKALTMTEEKMLVLEERARLGQCLFHPEDAQREE